MINIRLTNIGIKNLNHFLNEMIAMRKEILDANKDTCDDTNLPTMKDIICDIECGDMFDIEGDYLNCWGVTDNYDKCVMLERNVDFVISEV